MRGVEQEPAEEFGDAAQEIRIACIDVGGGTTDLMIAKYRFESKIDDAIRGEVLHQDGIYLGGDQLVNPNVAAGAVKGDAGLGQAT